MVCGSVGRADGGVTASSISVAGLGFVESSGSERIYYLSRLQKK